MTVVDSLACFSMLTDSMNRRTIGLLAMRRSMLSALVELQPYFALALLIELYLEDLDQLLFSLELLLLQGCLVLIGSFDALQPWR